MKETCENKMFLERSYKVYRSYISISKKTHFFETTTFFHTETTRLSGQSKVARKMGVITEKIDECVRTLWS